MCYSSISYQVWDVLLLFSHELIASMQSVVTRQAPIRDADGEAT